MQSHPRNTLFSLLVGAALVSLDWGFALGIGAAAGPGLPGQALAAPLGAESRADGSAAGEPEGIRVAMADTGSRRQRLSQTRRHMILPSRGAITSRFGPRRLGSHHGVDLRAKVGTPVKAALPGTVVFSGWKNSIYGNMVAVSHGNGLMTRYAHNSRLLVRPGQRVAQGQAVARSGNTGRTTGPHIHFEVFRNGRAVNPLGYAR